MARAAVHDLVPGVQFYFLKDQLDQTVLVGQGDGTRG